VSKKNRIRIYIDAVLQIGGVIACTLEQAHYLVNVLRIKKGDEVYVFNGRDGEFCTIVASLGKKECLLEVKSLYKKFAKSPDVWLLFAPLKKDNTDLVAEKATELGASKIVPVITEYTNAAKVRPERLQTQIIEAAEQSRRQDIPELAEVDTLQHILQNWPSERTLFYLDETGGGSEVAKVFKNSRGPAALLVGPEGGFSEKELEILQKCKYTCAITLGKRILRAETAVMAALACWQALCGDWK
jgi:16S rRNA (uracil1498-N3)-methyltransferase